MPISPDRMKLYAGGSIKSPEWLAIRASILERSRHGCEQCHVPNHSIVRRGVGKDSGLFMFYDAKPKAVGGYRFEFLNLYDENGGNFIGEGMEPYFDWGKEIKILLTIAHLDHDPTNNDPDNLKALCQLHHNRLDAKFRADRRRMSHTKDMFLDYGAELQFASEG